MTEDPRFHLCWGSWSLPDIGKGEPGINHHMRGGVKAWQGFCTSGVAIARVKSCLPHSDELHCSCREMPRACRKQRSLNVGPFSSFLKENILIRVFHFNQWCHVVTCTTIQSPPPATALTRVICVCVSPSALRHSLQLLSYCVWLPSAHACQSVVCQARIIQGARAA